MANFYYRIDSTGRTTKCYQCDEPIEKGENVVQLSVWAGNKGGSCSYCLDCGKKIIDGKIEKFREFREHLDQATKVYYLSSSGIDTF